MKHVVLAWQCFQKLTDARGAFTHSPCGSPRTGASGRGFGSEDMVATTRG